MTIEILQLKDNTRDSWQSYYDKLPDGHCYSSPSYINFLSGVYGDDAELCVFHRNNELIYYPYFKRILANAISNAPDNVDLSHRYDAYSSWYYGGPISNVQRMSSNIIQDFNASLREHFLTTGCVTEFIRFDANLENWKLRPTEAVLDNRETVFVPLVGRTKDQIWDGFTSSNRRAIRKAEKSGINVVAIDNANNAAWAEFSSIYGDEMVRKDAPNHLRFSINSLDDLRENCGPSVQLLLAQNRGETLGGFIIIHDEKVAFHFLSASRVDSWDLRINNLLFARAILWAKEHGVERFDFMGGRPGVFRFKSSFSSDRGRFKVLQTIYDESLYQALVAVQPVVIEDNFPAYVPR